LVQNTSNKLKRWRFIRRRDL